MDKQENTINKYIPTQPNQNSLNAPPENDQHIASQSIVDETNRLYMYHLKHQMAGAGLKFPLENIEYLATPHNVNSLQVFANQFAASPQRTWVHEQAQNVDLDSLNFMTFHQLLFGLFQEGEETWERVLVLFYFCTDLSIRALQEKMVHYFIRIHNWTTCYISRRLSAWVEEQGGWGTILQTSINYGRNLSIVGACCMGVLLLCLYIRSR